MASILAFFRRLLRLLGLGGHHGHADPAPAPPPPAPAAPVPPSHPMEEPRLGGEAPGPVATTLAMPQLMALAGAYPTRGDGGTTANFTQAMVQTFAGSIPAFGAPRAEGQEIKLESPEGQALFSVLGMSFGGEMPTSFAIPNLVGRAAIGGQQVGMMGRGTLVMTWLISTGSSAQAPMPGMLAMFGGVYAPDGWAICDGSLLPIQQNVPLFQTIGAAFGGNGETNFALPSLNGGAAPVGAGQGPGRAPVTLGQQIAGPVPGLGVNYLIALNGPYPPNTGSGAFPATGSYIGQVVAYGGGQVPAGWASCDGSLLHISDNPPLFELLGTTYGGDGQSTFALPDLRGLMVTGLGG